MTHGSRGLLISPKEPIFLLRNFRPEDRIALMALRDENGRKYGYHFPDETVESLAMIFYGRKYVYTTLRSEVWLSFSRRIRSDL